MRLLLAMLMLQPRDDVVARGDADDALRRIGRAAPLRVELRNRRGRRCRRPVPPSVCTTTRSPGAERRCAGRSPSRKRLRAADRASASRRRAAARRPACSQLQHQPVGDQLDARRCARAPRARDRPRRTRARRVRRRYVIASAGRERDARRHWPARVASAPRRQQLRRPAAATPSRAGATDSCSRSLTPARAGFRAGALRAFDPAPRIRPWTHARSTRCATLARLDAARRRSPRSAWPRLPSAVAATARASRLGVPARDQRRARSRRPKADGSCSCGQRDRTVGSSTSGRRGDEDEHRRRRRLLERLQQRVLRRATSASASSMITTRRRPSNGRYAARSTTSRTCSILIEPLSPGSTNEHVGMDAARDACAGRRTLPQASIGRLSR